MPAHCSQSVHINIQLMVRTRKSRPISLPVCQILMFFTPFRVSYRCTKYPLVFAKDAPCYDLFLNLTKLQMFHNVSHVLERLSGSLIQTQGYLFTPLLHEMPWGVTKALVFDDLAMRPSCRVTAAGYRIIWHGSLCETATRLVILWCLC